ncbi:MULTISPECIES: hypothetical protein [unclassified Modestobacter]
MDSHGPGEEDSTSAAGSGLPRPAEFVPQLTPLPDADPEWVNVGHRYWAWSGFADDSAVSTRTRRSVWAETTTAIGDDAGMPPSRLYLAAAAGVRAALPALTCPTCQAPVTLRSRASLDALANGASTDAHCAGHDADLAAAVAKLTDPAARARRDKTRQAAAARRAEQEAQAGARQRIAAAKRAFDERRRTAVAREYPLQLAGETPMEWNRVGADLRTDVGVLAMLRYAPDSTPIAPLPQWTARLTPDTDLTSAALSSAYRSGLLRVHPAASPLDAFAWDVTFDDAWAAAGEDPAALPEPATSGFYPRSVAWYAWQGGSLGTAAEALDAHLSARTRAWLTTRVGQDDLRDLAAELIAAETRRYLEFQLAEHYLPEVPENHQARLGEALLRVARVRPLAETYCLAWQAARSAAAAAQANPRAPLAKMTTHAVNLFEQKAQQATTDPTWAIKPFREDTRVPLAALTRTVFFGLLNLDPMTASLFTVTAALPVTAAETLATGASTSDHATVDPALSSATQEDAAALRATLSWLAAQPDLHVDGLRTRLLAGPEEWITDHCASDTAAAALRTAWANATAVLDAMTDIADPRTAALAAYATAAAQTEEIDFLSDDTDEGRPAVYRDSLGRVLAQELSSALLAPPGDD